MSGAGAADAIDGRRHLVRRHALDGLRDRQGRDRRSVARHRRADGIDQLRADARPRAIVDEDRTVALRVRSSALERLEARPDRILAVLAPGHDVDDRVRQPGRTGDRRHAVRGGHHDDGRYRWRRSERVEGVGEQRAPVEVPVKLVDAVHAP